MLYEFLKDNRADLIARCQTKAAKRASPNAIPPGSEAGIPPFLAQLIETLRVEQTPEAIARRNALGHGKPSLVLVPSDIASAAAKHGDELRSQGATIDQVVHGYGDMCQALTELAMELDTPITVDEFHTFNRCLDDAISDAVTAFSGDADRPMPKPAVHAPTSQASLLHMHNIVDRALVSFAAIKAGQVALNGATSSLHEKSLHVLRALIDRGLEDGATGHAQAPAVKGGYSS